MVVARRAAAPPDLAHRSAPSQAAVEALPGGRRATRTAASPIGASSRAAAARATSAPPTLSPFPLTGTALAAAEPPRFRAAVAPLRRRVDAAPAALPTVDAVVRAERPEEPLHCLRPAALAAAARAFVAAFPGDTLYAVKCNPEPRVLRALWAGGVRQFDCASPAEVAVVRHLFGEAAGIRYMHPVKTRAAIREAYASHGVRVFAFDSADELAKLVAETGGDALGLVVRLAVKGGGSYDLSGKFGARPADAVELLRAARPHARTLGVSFHVGSQCLDPAAYAAAVALAGEVIRAAGVPVEVLDVGGGFPASYPDIVPPALEHFMTVIGEAHRGLEIPGLALWAEPGRALVAGGASVVVQVALRRDGALFINDGVYGALSDAGAPGFRFPCRLIPGDGREVDARTGGFELFGPTCDSADRMKGPFVLPACVREGDWLEIGQLGAYGAALRTAFNGFDRARLVDVCDDPMLATPGYPPN
ncbi:MAG: type III PLP-dependent enzyme [Alphaproteobacteria bacterium]|nr:type III PLP-dependent enzyme [Alphaproteobacteria bacterium]